MRALLVLLSLCAATLLPAGCGTTAQETFYTLNPVAAAGAGIAVSNVGYNIAVGPVKVPEMVDRPQLVVRRSPNRVDVLESHRWAQPLGAEIGRVLAADLAGRLHGARVMPAGDSASAHADYRIALDISQFDAVPAQGVTVQAVWTVRRAGAEPLTGTSLVREAAHGDGYEALAAAYARAIAAISAEIATALQS